MSWTRVFLFGLLLTFYVYAGFTVWLDPQSKVGLVVGITLFISASLMLPYIIARRFNVLCFNVSMILGFLLMLELLFFFRFVEHPSISTVALAPKKNFDLLEYLDSSPFFKLKANTEIRTSGYRGDDFTNLWVTDDLGYKNNFKNISQKRFDFLALGDSFTEAMGVATENAWPSLLSKNHNIKVYNAGVQGYASSQMYGTLMLLKDKINFEGIIIGALPSIYLREKHFLTSVKPRSGVGGIESIRLGTTGAGLGSTGRRLNGITDTFFVDLLRKALRKVRKISFKDLLSFSNESSAFPTIEGPLARYRSELLNSMPDSIEEVNHNRYWREQLSNYKKIISWAKANDKVVYLVQFPHRHEIYFSPSFQGLQSILDTQYYVELELLKRELDEYVRIIDLFPVIKSAFEKEPNRMMYFKIDGHMNEYGQELISNSLAKSLKSKTH